MLTRKATKLIRCLIVVIILLTVLVACGMSEGVLTSDATTVPVEGRPEPGPTLTPADCTPLPEGMSLETMTVSPTTVSVELEGLQPGEQLIFLFTAEALDDNVQVESRSVEPVGEDGRYSFSENLEPVILYLRELDPGGDRRFDQWELKVIHARDVACASITLP